MKRVVILSACRTAGGKFGGGLSRFEASDLGAVAIKEAVKRSGVSIEDIEEVIMGNGWQAGVGANPARIAMFKAGLPQKIPAFTVNIRCGSGIRTIMLGADRIRLGDAKVIVGGGMESASNVPYILPEARWGMRMGDKNALDVLQKDGFLCPLAGMLMGEATESLAEEFHITREEQDEFSLNSHRKACKATEEGLFKDEIVPLSYKDRKKGEIVIDKDEIPRPDTSMEALAKLPPVFKEGGTITAGSSSALCDAGSALVIADEDFAKANGLEPMAEIIGYAAVALEAERFGLSPTLAIPKALERAGLSLDDMDLIEINEAFAAQVIACHRVMPFDIEKLNVHGGAIALGHPIGATGAKILTTLLYALRNHDKELGVASACIGGGQGVAIVVRRLK
ncbi:acetyl-CoA acetyltransferase [Acetomicrobium thermoterrenum DSM 13490]|uniref:Acetyl-CoA acetyltransferase n=1 Tax=Acetomicrobium thermoterrenum DSM 13490 TaxID=1120987 RepID=A0A1H3G4A2_9BACT|nr:thiolase family protein [Acetomicrobium thermoterrenum]SDX98071.1 acetyl-CoA acetyltransferase [Acetomicrobium thermoterrenum DSM 13490]